MDLSTVLYNPSLMSDGQTNLLTSKNVDAIRTTLHRIAKHALDKSYQEPKMLLYDPNAIKQLRPDLVISCTRPDLQETMLVTNTNWLLS